MGPMVILVIVITAALTSAAGVAWTQWLEHQRRLAAMEVIKAALAAGKEAPQAVLDDMARAGRPKAPWSEVVLFGALSFGFWLAFARVADEKAQNAFFIVAATMTVTAFGCLALALLAPRRPDGR